MFQTFFTPILLEVSPWTNAIVRNLLIIGGVAFFFYVIMPGLVWLANELNKRAQIRREVKYQLEQREREQKYLREMLANIPPVLYLRPFAIDGSKISTDENRVETMRIKGMTFGKNLDPVRKSSIEVNFERALSETAEKIGPFVAIGKPRSANELELGAYRYYYPDEIWKDNAMLLMNNAAMILVRIKGYFSDGLNWEINQITRSFLHKTVFLIEITSSADYENIKRKLKTFNLNLPAKSDGFKHGGYVSFHENKKPVYSDSLYLNKVFIQCEKQAARVKRMPRSSYS
jgi:hypothetical protein